MAATPQRRREAKEKKARQMAATDRELKLESLVAPTLEAMGYALVRLLVMGGHRPTLQIMAERRDGRPMSLDDCTAISRALSAKLDVEDPIEGSYCLEVSSPGIERPLTRPADFARFQGRAARLETRDKIGGRRKFSGTIVGASDSHVRLLLEAGPGPAETVEIAFADLARAKLLAGHAPLADGARPPPPAEPERGPHRTLHR